MAENNVFHWADQTARKIFSEKGDKDKYTLAAGITPSGTIHMGNFREIITVDLIRRAIKDAGKDTRFIYSWDDYDPFRKVPKNMPQQDILEKYLMTPLTKVPDTTEEYDSYADKREKPVEESLPKVGINPEFIRQSEMFGNCKYAEYIKIALQKRQGIKEILDKYRKEPLEENWYPATVYCEECNKANTKITGYDEEYNVTYECDCGHSNTFDIREKGIIKLKWRSDWPMRWAYENVDFESGGKDHFAAGGSFDTAVQIVKYFDSEAPTSIRYEWISIKGGSQFSSSEGDVITLQDVLEVYEPEIIRYLFASTKAASEFAVSFDMDVIKIYEDFDKCERIYFKEEEVSDKEYQNQKRIYELSSINLPEEKPYRVGFRHLINILQINEMDVEKTMNEFKDNLKNETDEEKLRTRIQCVKNWLNQHAPEMLRFKVQEDVPQNVELDKEQKEALHSVADVLDEVNDDKELHQKFYEICEEYDLNVKQFFKAAYNVLINKNKGPKLANFILTIGKDKVKALFEKV